MRAFVTVSLVVAALAASPALGAGLSENPSNASRNLSSASGLMVAGSMQTLAASGQVVVGALEVSGETTTLVLRGLAAGAEASIQVSSQLLAGMGVAVGTAVSVVVETAGYALVTGGRMLAYLPNESSQALLHLSREGR